MLPIVPHHYVVVRAISLAGELLCTLKLKRVVQRERETKCGRAVEQQQQGAKSSQFWKLPADLGSWCLPSAGWRGDRSARGRVDDGALFVLHPFVLLGPFLFSPLQDFITSLFLSFYSLCPLTTPGFGLNLYSPFWGIAKSARGFALFTRFVKRGDRKARGALSASLGSLFSRLS